MTTEDRNRLKVLASGLPGGKKATTLTREALLELLEEAYEIGRGTGYAWGFADGFEANK